MKTKSNLEQSIRKTRRYKDGDETVDQVSDKKYRNSNKNETTTTKKDQGDQKYRKKDKATKKKDWL